MGAGPPPAAATLVVLADASESDPSSWRAVIDRPPTRSVTTVNYLSSQNLGADQVSYCHTLDSKPFSTSL
jgi:hypothetical protein